MLDKHGCSVVEFCILFQSILGDVNSRVHWHRHKQCLDIMLGYVLPLFKFDVLYLFYIVLGIFVVMRELTMSDQRTLASSFVTPYMGTMGLKGCAFVECLGKS